METSIHIFQAKADHLAKTTARFGAPRGDGALLGAVAGEFYLPAVHAGNAPQRRAHVRVGVDMRVQTAMKLANRYYGQSNVEVLNLSGGGCRLSGTRPFIPNSTLRLAIPLPDRQVMAECQVVNTSPFPQGQHFTCGIAFTHIADADREDVIRFVFEKMRLDLSQGKSV